MIMQPGNWASLKRAELARPRLVAAKFSTTQTTNKAFFERFRRETLWNAQQSSRDCSTHYPQDLRAIFESPGEQREHAVAAGAVDLNVEPTYFVGPSTAGSRTS